MTSLDLLEPTDLEERKSLLAMQGERVKSSERSGTVRVRIDDADGNGTHGGAFANPDDEGNDGTSEYLKMGLEKTRRQAH